MIETIPLTTKVERDDLILTLAEQTGLSTKTVSMFYDALGDLLKSEIASANELHNVEIIPYDWLIIDSIYQAKRSKVNNFTGGLTTIPNKIKPKVTFTRAFLDSLIR